MNALASADRSIVENLQRIEPGLVFADEKTSTL